MSEKLTAYCLKLRENVEVENPRVEQAKNGVYFLKGNAKGNPDLKVSKILSKDDASRIMTQIGAA